MQATADSRFFNMQIFAKLLGSIRTICVERFISHLVMVDTGGVSQGWYRDFFRLAGFSRCRCQSSASSTQQLELRNCLALRESVNGDFSPVYDKVSLWLAEGRCTRTLLDSVASGEAAEVESRHFHDLLAELENERPFQGGIIHQNLAVRDKTSIQKALAKSVQRLAATKAKVQKPRTRNLLLKKKRWPSQDVTKKNAAGSTYKAIKKPKESGKSKENGRWCTRKSQVRQQWP